MPLEPEGIAQLIVVIVLIAAAIGLIVWLSRRAMQKQDYEASLVRTAEFLEETTLTVSGGISAVLLLLWNVGGVALYAGSPKTVFQEIGTLLLWIGGNQILIFGVMSGRKRRFIMRQRRRTGDGQAAQGPLP